MVRSITSLFGSDVGSSSEKGSKTQEVYDEINMRWVKVNVDELQVCCATHMRALLARLHMRANACIHPWCTH